MDLPRLKAFRARRTATLLALAACAFAGQKVARADPAELESEMTLEERLQDARDAVVGELGAADAVGLDRRPVTAELDEGGRLILVRHADAGDQALFELPGGTGRLQQFGPGGFRLILPLAGTAAGVEVGSEPILRFTTLFGGVGAEERVSLSSDESWADRFVTIELIRLPESMIDDPSQAVRFRVSRSYHDESAGDEPLQIDRSAESFAALRRRHRVEFDQWIAPLMRSMGLEAALEQEVRGAAAAVFLASLPADETVAAQVREAAKSLESPDFATRLAGEDALAKLGLAGAAEAARLLGDASAELTDDQQAALTAAVGRYATLPPEEVGRLLADAAFLRDVRALSGEPIDAALAAAAAAELAKRPTTRP